MHAKFKRAVERFVPFDELLATLDSDSSGDVDLEECAPQLAKLLPRSKHREGGQVFVF